MNEHTNNLGSLATLKSTRLPVKCGCDYVRDPDGNPVTRTRAGVKAMADRIARQQSPKGFWSGVVADCGTHYRVNVAGMPMAPGSTRTA